MNKLQLLIALTMTCLITTARAAISVGPSGSPVQTFNTAPTPADGWSSLTNRGASADITSVAQLTTFVNTNIATDINKTLPTSATVSPSISENNSTRYNTANQNIQSVPTGVGYTTVMATLQNDSGSPLNSLTISYDLGELNAAGTTVVEELPGFHIYFSLTGTAGSWTEVPALSSGTPGNVSATFSLGGTWAQGSQMYVLWTDDNANANRDNAGNDEGGYTIDNVVFSPSVVVIPLSVTLTSPTNSILLAPTNVIVTATTQGSTPATSVSFYTNNVLFFTDTTAPYSNQLVNLPAGTYSIYARAANGVDPDAYSATNTVIVRSEFVAYPGSIITENFDGMTNGIVTPVGWYVGISPVGAAQFVSVGDGSAAPNASVHGWNYGLTGDNNRALGTAPTGADRNTIARIQNQTSSNILSFNIFFDAEVWRTHQTNTYREVLTNLVSFDLGATWIHTAFDFEMPPDVANTPAATMLDGTQSTNRVSGIGGTVICPTPVPPGGVIYVRWHNINDAGTDGAMAIDNFSFQATAFSSSSFFVNITTPTSGQSFPATCPGTTNITATASASFSATNVAFSLDGGAAVNDAVAPYSVTFNNVGVGAHTITATAKDSSGATATTNVAFSVTPNVAPVVSITNIFTTNLFNIGNALSGSITGNTFAAGSMVVFQFSATDADGLANLECLVNNHSLFVTNISYGQMFVNDLLAGTNVFTVRATDNCGGVTSVSTNVIGTNQPSSSYSLIVSNGAIWKYMTGGSEPANDGGGNPWYASAYDDSAWASGLAELGGGDAVSPPNTVPERTVIDIGPGGNRYHAVYFRKTFNVSSPSLFSSLIVSALADDGCAVYLNGSLLTTVHMTNDVGVPVTYADFAGPGAIAHDGTVYYSTNRPNTLVAGNNTLAVSVHQDAISSSDISFDLMLFGVGGGPALKIRVISATQADISWPLGTGGLLYRANTVDAPPGSWVLETAIDNPSGGFHHVTVSTTGGIRFWTLRQ